MTWVHTTGGYLYDTASGDLDVGDYAVQPNGSNIVNAPPFVSSTSTPATIDSPASDSSQTTSPEASAPLRRQLPPTTTDTPSVPATDVTTPTSDSTQSASAELSPNLGDGRDQAAAA
jgi:hypothetical protein